MALDKLTQITSTGINSTTPLNGISVSGIVTGGAATFDSVDVLGVITYDDVTNIDALGIVTARSGIDVNADGIIIDAGGLDVTGIVTARSGAHITSGLVGIGTDNPEQLIHVKGSYGTIEVENTNTAQYAGAYLTLRGPAGAERSTTLNHSNLNTGGTETYFAIEQNDSSGGYVKTLSTYSYEFDYWAFHTGATGTEKLRMTSEGEVLIGTTAANSFNGVGLKNNLIVAGSTSDTDITDNSSAAITISNKDGTADNTSGLHFAREDTDGDPHYAGASIVTQFKEAQVTGQYPKADLAFLTSTAANNAPSEKMRIYASGAVTTPSNPLLKINSTDTYGAYQSLHANPNTSIAQATAQINVGDTNFSTSGSNAYTFVCPVTGIYALHAHISLGDVSQLTAGDAGNRVIWSMAYTLGGGNLPLSNYVEVIDTNVWDYQNASYFDTWYFTAGTRVGMGINTNSGGQVAGHGFSWGMYLLQ